MIEFDWTYLRPAWEEPGWTIDEHSTSGPVRWDLVDKVVIHYTSAPDVPDGDPDELPWFTAVRNKIRATQRDYVTDPRRGYSIGYSACVPQDGTSWLLRGQQFVCAANHVKDHNYNAESFAILVLVDGTDPASPECVATIRRLVAWVRSKASKPVRIIGHRDLEPTGCPGAGLYGQIQAGMFEPSPTPQPPEDDMPTWDDRRLIDTRKPPLGGRLKVGQTLPIDTGYPNAVRAIVNITTTDPTGPCFVSAASNGTSKVNDNPAMHTVANECTVPVTDGKIHLTAHSADVHLVVDLVGVWA